MRAAGRLAVAAVGVLLGVGLIRAQPTVAGGTSLTYTVTLTGNGSGYYNADGGIHCVRAGGITSGTCKVTYDLSGGAIPWGNAYAPDPGSCYVSGDTCQTGGLGLAGYLYPGPDQFVTMEFRLLDPVTITIKKGGTGSGTVKSTPRGIDCGSDCKSDYAKSSTFKVTATAKAGSTFTKWTGGPCDHQGATCTFGVSASSYTLTAIFTKTITATPTPAVTEPPTAAPTPIVTAGPTPVVPTPFPTTAPPAPTGAGPLASSPPTSPTADDGGRSTLILALSALLVIILAAGGLYAMRSRRPTTPTPPAPLPPTPPTPPA
jgi:hypothetical protein